MLRPITLSARTRNFFLCGLSAALLALAFPPYHLSLLAWAALIPLMFLIDGKKSSQAFGWAFLCGLLFFSATLYWFFNLTRWFSYIAAVGVVLLLCYLSLYFGVFGLAYRWLSRRPALERLFVLPAVWTVLEWVRGWFLSGFGWAGLGHSQYKNLFIIQIADITGVYGITFVIVMANVILKELISARFTGNAVETRKTNRILLGIFAVFILFTLVYGMFRLGQADQQAGRERENVPVAVIQANIAQEDKWDEAAAEDIVRRHVTISSEAALQHPQLLIWPETSVPGMLWEDRHLFDALQAFVLQAKIPVLFGSVLKQGDDYFNAALLAAENGAVTGVYKKRHLVPFGEFLPLRKVLPYLSSLVDIGDFTPGYQWTVFDMGVPGRGRTENKKFSVLICFEDTVPYLARGFVLNGARLLVNMTNDAWFGDTQAPHMHLQTAVFRTVENRRGLIRAANTGLSCFVDRWGRIRECVAAQRGGRQSGTYVSGFAIGSADFNDELTFYTKYGDIFTILCFGCILGAIILRRNIAGSRKS